MLFLHQLVQGALKIACRVLREIVKGYIPHRFGQAVRLVGAVIAYRFETYLLALEAELTALLLARTHDLDGDGRTRRAAQLAAHLAHFQSLDTLAIDGQYTVTRHQTVTLSRHTLIGIDDKRLPFLLAFVVGHLALLDHGSYTAILTRRHLAQTFAVLLRVIDCVGIDLLQHLVDRALYDGLVVQGIHITHIQGAEHIIEDVQLLGDTLGVLLRISTQAHHSQRPY